MTVEGQPFVDWCASANADPADICKGITFSAYAAAGDGAPYSGAPTATGALSHNGLATIASDDFAKGWYAVEEALAPGSQAAMAFCEPDAQYVYFDGASFAGCNLQGFNYEGEYWATDAFFNRNLAPNLSITYVANSVRATNPWCDDYVVKAYFGPSNYGKTFSSFCASYSSESLGGDAYGSDPTQYAYVDKTGGFAAENPGAKENILTAFNYIYDKWGSLDKWPTANGTPEGSTKLIAEIATWLLAEGDVTEARSASPGYEFVNEYVDETIKFVNENPGSIVNGDVSDIVYLAHAGYPAQKTLGCQPQIVPIYGAVPFDNKPHKTAPPPGVQRFTVDFTGIRGVKLEYYTNVTGWRTVPGGLFDDSATFDIPKADQATYGVTTIRAVKSGMYYTMAFTLAEMLAQPVRHIDVPVRTIRVYGIDAACSLAIVQNDWVYSYAPANVGGMNYFNVFGNGKAYEVRLYKEGFYPICRADVNVSVPNADGYTDVNYSQKYFYPIAVPDGVTNLRMQSYNWIYNKSGPADPQIMLLGDIDAIKAGSMAFTYKGTAYNVAFLLDGTNPFAFLLL